LVANPPGTSTLQSVAPPLAAGAQNLTASSATDDSNFKMASSEPDMHVGSHPPNRNNKGRPTALDPTTELSGRQGDDEYEVDNGRNMYASRVVTPTNPHIKNAVRALRTMAAKLQDEASPSHNINPSSLKQKLVDSANEGSSIIDSILDNLGDSAAVDGLVNNLVNVVEPVMVAAKKISCFPGEEKDNIETAAKDVVENLEDWLKNINMKINRPATMTPLDRLGPKAVLQKLAAVAHGITAPNNGKLLAHLADSVHNDANQFMSKLRDVTTANQSDNPAIERLEDAIDSMKVLAKILGKGVHCSSG
jgi:hypothetical protein